MIRFLIIIFILSSSLSCRHIKEQEVFVNVLELEPVNNYFKPDFSEEFFKEAHFNYGGDLQIDSTKYFYTSETTIIEDTTKYFLRNCKATLQNDSLLLQFTDSLFSPSRYELKILKLKNQFISDYYQTFSVLDSSYKAPVYKIIGQSVILDKNEYKKTDSLKGKIAIKVSAFYSWTEKYTDTLNIYGLIKTIVE